MTNPIPKMPKGGKRDGAGKPPRDPNAPLSANIPKIQVRPSAELRERFKAKAERLGLTEAEAARLALQEWVERDG